jgi:hypothetical protein
MMVGGASKFPDSLSVTFSRSLLLVCRHGKNLPRDAEGCRRDAGALRECKKADPCGPASWFELVFRLRTSNVKAKRLKRQLFLFTSMFNVGRSMFDVRAQRAGSDPAAAEQTEGTQRAEKRGGGLGDHGHFQGGIGALSQTGVAGESAKCANDGRNTSRISGILILHW